MCEKSAVGLPRWVTLKMELGLPGMSDPKMLDPMSEPESEASQLNVRKGDLEEEEHHEKITEVQSRGPLQRPQC